MCRPVGRISKVDRLFMGGAMGRAYLIKRCGQISHIQQIATQLVGVSAIL